jgi:citrate synthase
MCRRSHALAERAPWLLGWVQIAATRLIAKMPMIAAMVYRSDLGLPTVYPDYDRSFSENLLYMLFKNPMRDNYPALMDPPTFECVAYLPTHLKYSLRN